MTTDLLARAREIRLLMLDVDGVMSDGRIIITDAGDEIKAFHVQDGLGIQFLLESGLQVAVITGRESPMVATRIKQLKIPYLYQGQFNKVPAYEELLGKLNLRPEQVAHIGDDFPDVPLFKRIGLAITVANAVPQIKKYSHWTTEASGGNGAVREACDMILMAQEKWQAIEDRFAGE